MKRLLMFTGMTGMAGIAGFAAIPADKDTFWRRTMDAVLPAKTPSAEECEVVQIHTIFRHGSRTPFEDSDDNPKIWAKSLRANLAGHAKVSLKDMHSGDAADDRPSQGETKRFLQGGAGAGVLTKAGLSQGVELGGELKQRYIDTGVVRGVDELLLRCSLTTRTVETLQGVLTGMFGHQPSRMFEVFVGKKGKGSAHTDYLNFNTPCCPRLQALYDASVAEWSEDRMPVDVRPLVEQASSGTALTMSGQAKKYGPIAWRDWTSCRTGAGLSQLPGVDRLKFDLLEDIAGRQVQTWFSGPGDGSNKTETLKLSHGRTLEEFLERLEETAAHKGAKASVKMVLYSAHDWTILPLMLMFQPSRLVAYPQFCSELTIELLREKEGKKRHFVRVLFGKGTAGVGQPRGTVEPVIVEGCGGGELCELSRFRRCVSAYIPKNFDIECSV